MFKTICVTNRSLCMGDFEKQIERIAKAGVQAIILREKELQEMQYKELAEKVIRICEIYHAPCILHSFINTATELGQNSIHLPLYLLKKQPDVCSQFQTIGVSVHSAGEAIEAERLGATYLTAGHIFQTDCKKGLPPRGIPFLQEVVESVSIPVYAIGGVSPDNVDKIQDAGAKGACIMSGFMKEPNPEDILQQIQNKLKKSGKINCRNEHLIE